MAGLDRLKALRLEKGLTQQQMADALGVDRTTYAKYESGANEPGLAMIQAMARFFGVTIDYLVGRSSSRQGIVMIKNLHVSTDKPLDEITEDEWIELEDLARVILGKRDRLRRERQGEDPPEEPPPED